MKSEVILGVGATRSDGQVYVGVETACCWVLLNYMDKPEINMVTTVDESATAVLHMAPPQVTCSLGECSLLTSYPTLRLPDGISTVAGLSSVLRQIVKQSGEEWKKFLGFRGSCLAAPAEVSQWTRFCEVDMVSCSQRALESAGSVPLSVPIPPELATLESHLAQPSKVHNIGKYKDGAPHSYIEGPHMSLADLVIATCVYITLKVYNCFLSQKLPLTSAWLKRVLEDGKLGSCLSTLGIEGAAEESLDWSSWLSLSGTNLYRKERARKEFTQHEDVETSLQLVSAVDLIEYSEPAGAVNSLPPDQLTLPDVPASRLGRKVEQLENLTKAAIQVSKGGDVIVDFCSGSGHLGLILARLIPSATVILLDNKEKSLERARLRVNQLNLSNVLIIQANLDYFIGDFQVGVALHACGVASDLVAAKCLSKRASLILCPCCYGGIRSNHSVEYPLSDAFRSTGLNERGFIVLGHCADTEDSERGSRAMQAVDSDRCLYLNEHGYTVSLSKLIPPDCTTRNNLIIALPN